MNSDTFRYFDIEDFECPCCKENNIDLKLILMLDSARHIAGIPFIINSGCRCKKHNKEVDGKIDSEHLIEDEKGDKKKCTGADIKVKNSHERFLITMALGKVGFNRIGTGKNFIHAGISKTHPQNVEWLY